MKGKILVINTNRYKSKMAFGKRQPIGVELVKKGIVTEEDVQRALLEQKKNPNRKLGEIIKDMEICDPRTLIQAIGETLGIKGVILTSDSIRINVLDYISVEMAKKYCVIPFDVDGSKVKVCFADTTNKRNYDAVKMLMLNRGLIVEPYVTYENIIRDLLDDIGGKINENMNKIGQEDNITELVDSIIKTGMKNRASDIHIEPQNDEIRVMYTKDGGIDLGQFLHFVFLQIFTDVFFVSELSWFIKTFILNFRRKILLFYIMTRVVMSISIPNAMS